MKVTKDQKDALNIALNLEIEEADYAEKVRKKLAERRRNADFKGFRKGMVPPAMIRRVYGEQCLVDSVNELIGESIDSFIRDEKLNIIGEPLPAKNQPENEWKEGNTFHFTFDLGLYPEFKVEAGSGDEIPHYQISMSAKDKSGMVESLKKYYGEKKEEKSDEDIEKEVTDRLHDQYRQEADWRLNQDIRGYFIDKAAIELPEDFLKRWLFAANDGKYTKEDIEKEFDAFKKDFCWQLVRGEFLRNFGIKIGDKDIDEAVRAYVTYQYAMYGMGNVPADIIENSMNQIRGDRRQMDRILEQVEDEKVLAKLKETVTIKAKKISAEKFRELK